MCCLGLGLKAWYLGLGLEASRLSHGLISYLLINVNAVL